MMKVASLRWKGRTTDIDLDTGGLEGSFLGSEQYLVERRREGGKIRANTRCRFSNLTTGELEFCFRPS